MLRFAAFAATLVAVLMPAAVADAVELPKLPKAPIVQGCAGADDAPKGGAATRATVLCLLNETRARHHLKPLRQNARLGRAALKHSSDMVRRGYFEHTSPGGATMSSRILKARYVTSAQGYSLGENIAWGTSTLATPRAIMKAWMASPGHRENILRAEYREVGIGIVSGAPQRGVSGGATYTTDFGVRR